MVNDNSYEKSPVAKMEPNYFTSGLYFRGKFKSLIRAIFSGVKGYYAGEESICSKTGSSEYDSPRHLPVCLFHSNSIQCNNQYITIYDCRHEKGFWGQHFTFCGSTNIFCPEIPHFCFYHLYYVFDIMHFCNVCTMYQIRLNVATLTWTDFNVKRLQTDCECIYHISISLSIYIS